jgi:hypothetical protein
MHNLPIQCYASIHLGGEEAEYKIAIESSSAERGRFHAAVECRCRGKCKNSGIGMQNSAQISECETRRFKLGGLERQWLEYV